MDLSRFNTTAASDKARTLSLVNPFDGTLIVDDDGKTLDLHLVGVQSTAARNAYADRNRKTSAKLTDEQARRVGGEFLAALTTGWSNNLEMNGAALKYNRDNAIALYLSEDWIARQALEFVNDLGNFDPKA